MENQDMNQDMKQDQLFVNNLVYAAPTPSSVTINRVLKRQVFQNRSYTSGQTMTCQLNTGHDFVDCRNSSLVLKVKVTKSSGFFACGFGDGSAMNLVRNIRIYHRSGTCYTNTQRMNLYRKTEDIYNESQEWFSTVGQLMGYQQPSTVISNSAGVGYPDTFLAIIPLNKLHPFFQPEDGVFLPAQMASGLRVEIDLASLGEAFVATPVGSPSDYTIEDVYINTMSVALTDDITGTLNTVAQQQSLEYCYKDVFTSQNSQPSDSTSVNIDINRSVGYADHALSVIQYSSYISNLDVDSFATFYQEGNWWYTLGSNQYPNQKIDTEKGAYSTALITFDKFKGNNPSSVTIDTFANNHGVYAVSLERDTALALSQSPVNASRMLRFEGSFNAVIGVPTIVTVFLTYICSARSSILSSKVDI